jgi:hypothetical protein
VRVNNIPKFKRVKCLTYEYRDYETGYFIEEDQYITNDNKLFFHLYDAVLHEYNINLADEPLIYI